MKPINKEMKEEDKKTRIKLKWSFTALGYVLALQRKKTIGWKTVSWVYPSIMEDATCEYIREWLEWDEEKKPTEFQIGKMLMSKCFDN